MDQDHYRIYLNNNLSYMGEPMNVEKLIEMWRAGASGAVIAASLGVTRSAVLGKVYRLREQGILAYRNAEKSKVKVKEIKEPKEDTTNVVRLERKVPHTTQGGSMLRIRPEEPEQKPVVPPPIPQYDPDKPYLNILQLNFNKCRYIMTDDTSVNAFYCGETVHRRSYCKAHADICLVPAPKKVRDTNAA